MKTNNDTRCRALPDGDGISTFEAPTPVVPRFTIVHHGYLPLRLSLSLKEANERCREDAAVLLQAARRNHPEARKHKLGDGCYRVTLGPDKGSTVYGHVNVIPA